MIQAEAIINSTNEELSELEGLGEEIAKLAGPELFKHIQLLDGCKPGEAKATPSCSLPYTSK